MYDIIPIFAMTTHGLEGLSSNEMADVGGLIPTGVLHRRIEADFAGDLSPLLALRTIDDLFIEVGRWSGVGATQPDLEAMADDLEELELLWGVKQIATVRGIPDEPSYSVTVSSLGKRNYGADDVRAKVTRILSRQRDTRYWRYVADDRDADLNLRIHLDHSRALVGLRLAATPMQNRPWLVQTRPGALKGPVAAAMCILAELQPGEDVVDPCCGTGTIAIEVALMGAGIRAGDIAPAAIECARANAASASVDIIAMTWDARRLPLPDDSVDCVISNLPWGRQVVVDDGLAELYAEIGRELVRVVVPGGRVCLLTGQPERVALPGCELYTSVEVSLHGQHPTIGVWLK